jgi:hypothetical protein
MAKSSIPSPDEALAGMAKQGRTPMNKDGIKFSSPSASPKAGTLVPKKNTAAGDPSGSKGAPRSNVPATGQDRAGAAYSIKGGPRYTQMTDPAAGATQANGRIISTAAKRDRANFDSGNSTSY